MKSDLFATRSILFLPASNPRAIAKARESSSDLVVLDLEDAVKPEDKADARSAALEAVSSNWPMPVAIRINGIGTKWHSPDIDAVAQSKCDYAILPRASSGHFVREVRTAVAKPLMAMIETAAGVLAANEIANEAGALIAGTNDLRTDLRLPLDATREPISAALQIIVLAARANGVPAFDGVFNRLSDLDGFVAECMHGRSLGFDGKSLIHPDQIGPCNEAFGPSEEEVESARRLVEAFSGGAERFEDRMIERMHVEAARRVLERVGQA
ncbi:MAG TPA: CoA ester lyase [Sphingomicrobium sp.]|nr:CoA ester lyase [Sphingomicrobium sp.]